MRKTCDGCKHMPKVYMPGQGICSSCVNYNLWEEKKESKGEYSHSRWESLLETAITQIKALSSLKGGEYAGDTDRLANFRRNAVALGLPMETVWAVYSAKHMDAIMQYVKDLNTGRQRERLEPISGRVDDLIVYLLLFKAILEEHE